MTQALLDDAPTLFLNAKLVDGNGGPPVEDGAVSVEGNRITRVGRTSDWGENPNGNNRVVDLNGKTLMPGLTEGHFHISFWGVRELPDLVGLEDRVGRVDRDADGAELRHFNRLIAEMSAIGAASRVHEDDAGERPQSGGHDQIGRNTPAPRTGEGNVTDGHT